MLQLTHHTPHLLNCRRKLRVVRSRASPSDAPAPEQSLPPVPPPAPPPPPRRPAGSRRSITSRIEELKRRNESLKQAIGLFLDQPGDVGAVTGKPTGTWDEDSTASLLEQLRKQRAAAGSSYLGSGEEETGSWSTSSSPGSPASPSSSSSTSAASAAAAADGSSDLQQVFTDSSPPGEQQQAWVPEQVGLEELAEAEDLPLGPVFDTSEPGTLWVEAAAAAEAAAAEAAAAEAEAEAAAAAAKAAAAAAAKPAAAPTPDTPAAAGPVMSVAEALAAVVPDGVAPGASSSNGVPSPAAASASAPVLTPPDAPPSSSTPTVKSLGSIHERVEQLEQEHEQQKQQQQKKGSKQKQAMKPRATARKPPPATTNPLDIVFVSAEVAPWSKTGGLGDVMGALPQAMAERGHRVMVVSPRYTNGGKDVAKYKDAKKMEKSVWVEVKGGWHELKFHVLHKGGVDYVFIEHIAFERPGTPYGDHTGPFKDNLFRFTLLSLGGLEAPLNLPIKRDKTGKVTDEVYGQEVMFVANDWHAALLPLLLTARFRPFGVYPNARCCLAIHNLAHQGSFETHAFSDVGLSGDWYSTLEWESPDDRNRRKTVNILKAGIVTSDILVTVSQGYAAEITGTPQDGRVDMLLAQRAPRLRGIVNGIDVTEWDPATDIHLAQNYSASDLSGKAACKRALQREMRLEPDPDIPLIGFIGRLDYQKGPDLVLDALPALSNLDCQLVILGTGAADYEARVRTADHEWGWFCRGHVGFSVPLGHKIMAGCDILLMPSRFEPCGLNQLYAMRYGTVPIAHATGGLMDTIENYNPFSKGDGEGVGWTFAPAAIEPMVAAVSSAVSLFREDPDKWRALQLRGMEQDVSWERAAQQYELVLTEAMIDAAQFSKK